MPSVFASQMLVSRLQYILLRGWKPKGTIYSTLPLLKTRYQSAYTKMLCHLRYLCLFISFRPSISSLLSSRLPIVCSVLSSSLSCHLFRPLILSFLLWFHFLILASILDFRLLRCFAFSISPSILWFYSFDSFSSLAQDPKVWTWSRSAFLQILRSKIFLGIVNSEISDFWY